MSVLALNINTQYQYTGRRRLHRRIGLRSIPHAQWVERTVRLPDSDRFWLAVGFNQKLEGRTSIDVGYSHVFFRGAEINRPSFPNPSLQVVRGSFNADAHIISLQLNHHFQFLQFQWSSPRLCSSQFDHFPVGITLHLVPLPQLGPNVKRQHIRIELQKRIAHFARGLPEELQPSFEQLGAEAGQRHMLGHRHPAEPARPTQLH